MRLRLDAADPLQRFRASVRLHEGLTFHLQSHMQVHRYGQEGVVVGAVQLRLDTAGPLQSMLSVLSVRWHEGFISSATPSAGAPARAGGRGHGRGAAAAGRGRRRRPAADVSAAAARPAGAHRRCAPQEPMERLACLPPPPCWLLIRHCRHSVAEVVGPPSQMLAHDGDARCGTDWRVGTAA